MIVKEYEEKPQSNNRAIQAGQKAEKQMAFYLRRAFGAHDGLLVLNDVRIVDPAQQTESLLGEDACQIDHLVLHRWGMFIIESKSAIGRVSIRSDGSGGDEWVFGSQGRGSPLKQAEMQAAYLRTFISNNDSQLLGRFPKGTRTLAKLINGSDQRGVQRMPMQPIVALSDSATIERGEWKEPAEPFQTYVCKADLVPDKILTELNRHRSAAKVLSKGDGDYGMWSINSEEVEAIAKFLCESHTPRMSSVPKRVVSPGRCGPTCSSVKAGDVGDCPKCKECGSRDLSARSGRFGYYWLCRQCNASTSMSKICGVCGVDGKKSKEVRVRKDGPKYFRSCASCGIEECIWTEPANAG